MKVHGNTRHGMYGTPAYKTWYNMIQRCTNPNNTGWKSYGGRGIEVCDAWRSFEGFYLDMGERPEGHTLDRIDNDGGYEPDNCRWATIFEQNNNRRPRTRPTHCIRGHAFDGENTYVDPKTGRHGCRICRARCKEKHRS